MVIDWSANAVSERSALSREGEPIPAAPHPSRVSVSRRVSIGIAHRSLLFAESLGELLTKEEDFRVVTVGSSAEVALRGAGRIRDGVQLIDATFVAESPSLLQAIASAAPSVRVVLMMAVAEDEQILEGLEGGVRGIILESMGARLLVNCIRKVNAGEEWIEQVSAARLLRRFAQRDAPLSETLSRRELEVIRAVARGLSNREIAAELSINAATVKSHVHNVFRKLELTSRVAVTNWARAHRVK